MKHQAPILSVVIGTCDRLDQLKRCISSVLEHAGVPVQVFVTDAGSTDGTVEYLRELGDPRVTPVLEGKRLGQATAYNRVFRGLSSRYTCWLSDDNEIVDRGLERAVRIMDADAGIGMAALKVRDVQGPFVEAPYIGGISSLGILNVNQGVLRTSDLLRVGGFSEWFQLYGIDPDLTAKILLLGLDVVYTRDVAILHYRNWPAQSGTLEYQRVMDKQKEAQEKYRRKYGDLFPPDHSWDRKKRLWERLKRRNPELARINSPTPVAGSLPRDWHNMMNARFITWRERRQPHKLYHLRQHVPAVLLPATLPQDPT